MDEEEQSCSEDSLSLYTTLCYRNFVYFRPLLRAKQPLFGSEGHRFHARRFPQCIIISFPFLHSLVRATDITELPALCPGTVLGTLDRRVRKTDTGAPSDVAGA